MGDKLQASKRKLDILWNKENSQTTRVMCRRRRTCCGLDACSLANANVHEVWG